MFDGTVEDIALDFIGGTPPVQSRFGKTQKVMWVKKFCIMFIVIDYKCHVLNHCANPGERICPYFLLRGVFLGSAVHVL